MVLSYCETKESVVEDFNGFHNKLGYPVDQTLYATLGESEYSEEYTQTDECCIYLNYALLLLEKGENIDFMRERLLELIEKKNMDMYRDELLDEFDDFENDLNILKQCFS